MHWDIKSSNGLINYFIILIDRCGLNCFFFSFLNTRLYSLGEDLHYYFVPYQQTPKHKVKNAVCGFQITCTLLYFTLVFFKNKGKFRPYQTLCPYNLLPWKWIYLKLDVKWKYLLCLIFAHTSFLHCTEH